MEVLLLIADLLSDVAGIYAAIIVAACTVIQIF
jgi:hypothetical protein